MEGLCARHQISLIETPYSGEVLTITPEISNGDQGIVITGRAVERGNGLIMPNVPLNLVIFANGFERKYPVFTDTNSTFSYTFTPLAGEGGLYQVWAVHPQVLDKPAQGQFTINRVSIHPQNINLNVPRNYEQNISIQVTTGEATMVHNLWLVYEEQDQLGGVFPQGIHVTTSPPVAELNSSQTASLEFKIWADNSAAETGRIVLKVKSEEKGDQGWGLVILETIFSEAHPALFFTPDHVETGVAYGQSITETITLENKGLADLMDVSLAVVAQDGAPAPAWAHLNSAQSQGTISVGEKHPVSITFSPTQTSAPEGIYALKLRVSSSNYQTTDIHISVSVTQAGLGHVQFKVADIYTGTMNQNQEIIQGLDGATIKVQNEEVVSVEQTKTTDSLGEALFSDLPSGRYKCRVTASNHQEYIGRLWIKPGITTNQEVFLSYNLVTVEWKVVETTIQDKYEIVLQATYETDVPAAVVVVEPTSVNLPKMETGDVYYGEFALTNYGLIRAEELDFILPSDDENFRYELLTGLPDTLEAKERITVPYRVICLKSLDQIERRRYRGAGDDSICYRACLKTCYLFECMYIHGGKHWFEEHCILGPCFFYGDCYSGSSGVSGGTNYGWGDGIGGWSSPGPSPQPIDGIICWPVGKRREILFEKFPSMKDTLGDVSQEVGCSVNCVLREYNDEAVDLSVKVPGGSIDIQRLFYGNKWHWEHNRNNLRFNWSQDAYGEYVESIDKGGVIYEASPTSRYPIIPAQTPPGVIVDYSWPFFTHDTYTIYPGQSGFLWRDKLGNWKKYDISGRMISYGTDPTGDANPLGKFLYEEGESGRLIGIADRNDRQIIWFEYNDSGQISVVRDSENRRVEYSYTDGRLTRVKDVLGHETLYEYDSSGSISKSTDAAGRPSIISYDSYGNVAQVVDGQGHGHFFKYSYDEAKREYYAQIKSSSGMIKEVWYDQEGETRRVDLNGRMIRKIVKDGRNLIITDEKGNNTRKEFDGKDNLIKVVNPDGSVVSFEYKNPFSRLTRMIDPRGSITEYQYDHRGNLVKKIEAVGTSSERITTYTYNEYGLPLSATIAADAHTESATTTMAYDANGNLASMTDPLGHTTEFLEYDNLGNLLKKKDPRGHIRTYAYDDMGRSISQTDPLNNTTTYEYDEANNRTALINAQLKQFGFAYDDHNNLIKAVDPYGKFMAIEYNTDNLPIRTVDQEGKQTSSEYDNEGRLTKSFDGAGNLILYYYDETKITPASSDKPVRIDYPTYSHRIYYDQLQRVIRETDILDDNTSPSTSYVYDAAGNVLSKTDEEGNITHYEYDAANRLIKTIDPLGGITERSYDNRGNLITLKGPKGGITRYEYDLNNQLVKEIRPMGEQTRYEYDADGNRTALIDAKDQKIAYEYDAANRLIRTRYFAAGDQANPIKTVTFTYDQLGNLISYHDGTTSATYTYDDLKRKIGESVNYGPFTLSYAYTYLANGLKKSFTGPDGLPLNYGYDENNRLSSIGIQGHGQVTYNTYLWNSPTKITLPGGTTAEYTYDPLMQLKSIDLKDPSRNPVIAYAYEYSGAGNITAKNTEHGHYGYQYDKLYRLTEALNPTATNEGYTYDAIGNRLTSSGVEGNWSYNENSELLGFAGTSYEYDENGHMTRKTMGGQVVDYIYDLEDRLVWVEDGSGSVLAEYYYDPFGRRLWKDVAGKRTHFFYADEGLIGEYDASGQEIKTYGYEPDSTWTTNPMFQKVGTNYYWYQNDHLGTPQKMIDTSGRVVWSGRYDAFGNCWITVDEEAGEIENNLRFPGQYYDAETGLYYNWHRYYDPVVGRYLQMDQIGYITEINLYSYVTNKPTNSYDSLGLCPENKDKDAVILNFAFHLTITLKENGKERTIGFGPDARMSDWSKFWQWGKGWHIYQWPFFSPGEVSFVEIPIEIYGIPYPNIPVTISTDPKYVEKVSRRLDQELNKRAPVYGVLPVNCWTWGIWTLIKPDDSPIIPYGGDPLIPDWIEYIVSPSGYPGII